MYNLVKTITFYYFSDPVFSKAILHCLQTQQGIKLDHEVFTLSLEEEGVKYEIPVAADVYVLGKTGIYF